jgi:hypothetical protein
MVFKTSFIVILLPLLFLACGSKDDSHEIPEMEFLVNSDLLGTSIRDSLLNVTFNPPLPWEPLRNDVFAEAKRQLLSGQSDSDTISVIPEYIFLDDKLGSSLIVSTVRFRTDSGTDNIGRYHTSLKEHFSVEDVLYSVYVKDGIYFHQYLLQNEEIINFKLLTQETDNTILQWDYVVPRNAYTFEVRAIESSIGSIKRIN